MPWSCLCQMAGEMRAAILQIDNARMKGHDVIWGRAPVLDVCRGQRRGIAVGTTGLTGEQPPTGFQVASHHQLRMGHPLRRRAIRRYLERHHAGGRSGLVRSGLLELLLLI